MSANEVRWIPDDDSDAAWFAVRFVFHRGSTYEEQVTLWRSPTYEAAEKRASREALEHASVVEAEVLPFAQIYRLAEFPGDGAEVFSLMRDSELEPVEYISRFFSTGAEREGTLDDSG